MLLGTASFRGALDPESLNLLQKVFDQCLRKLMIERRVSDPSQLAGTQHLVGKRIITAAEQGIDDPERLEAIALEGLIEPSAGGRSRAA